MTDLKRIDLNLLVVLDAILNEMNLTRAGEVVGMSQPAVSGALARLRQQFDDELLERKGRKYQLTKVAESLKPAVAEAMMEVRRTFELLPTFDAATSTRTFYIGATDYFLSQITSPLLNLLKDEAPFVDIKFNVLPHDPTMAEIDLLRRDVLIASPQIGLPGKKQALFSDNFVVIARKGHPAVKKGTLSLEQLKKLPRVHLNLGSNKHQVDKLFIDAAFDEDTEVVSVTEISLVPLMVSKTDLIGMVQERLARPLLDPLELQIVQTDLPRTTLIESVHYHPTKSNDPAIKWLIGMLRKAAEIIDVED
ncbi:MAG: LysR substrate-binding domain-containing protein [Micrococcales bacterium]